MGLISINAISTLTYFKTIFMMIKYRLDATLSSGVSMFLCVSAGF